MTWNSVNNITSWCCHLLIRIYTMELSNLFKITVVQKKLALILYVSYPGIYSDLCLKFQLCKEVSLNFIGYIKCLQYFIVHIFRVNWFFNILYIIYIFETYFFMITHYAEQVGTNTQRSSYFCFPCYRIKSMCHMSPPTAFMITNF